MSDSNSYIEPVSYGVIEQYCTLIVVIQVFHDSNNVAINVYFLVVAEKASAGARWRE